jgi:hypothetical protein
MTNETLKDARSKAQGAGLRAQGKMPNAVGSQPIILSFSLRLKPCVLHQHLKAIMPSRLNPFTPSRLQNHIVSGKKIVE